MMQTIVELRCPLSVAEELAEVLSVPVQMVEVHPTHERLEVSVVYLNAQSPS